MYYNNYRQNYYWDKEQNKDKYNRQECCFPIDIYFSMKEGKKVWTNEDGYDDFENNDQNQYQEYNFENEYNYKENQRGYNYQKENFGCQEKKCYEYQKDKNNYYHKDCNHKCCFPIDICLKIKEGKRCDKKEYDYDRNDRCDWDKENDYDWKKDHKCHHPSQNHYNCACRNNNRCCLGFLAGCLLGCRKR